MYCIFCGSAVAGSVTLRCDACGRTHYLSSKISASALTVWGEDYLVVRRGAEPQRGRWDLPGGFCEYGEHPGDAARRETLEETGLAVSIDALLGVWMDEYLEPDGRMWPTLNLIYLARLAANADTDPPGTPDGGEVTEIMWFPISAPPDDLAFPLQQWGALEAYRHYRHG
jgi:ADP-ribose pyrophosphatase YjhB (NUDIX family)